jgi:hypothetical protein
MKAFHGDETIKAKYLARVRAHAAADEIVKGRYWEDGKGCAVGCTLHSSDHMAYEKELGIPVHLARLEDVIFESLQNGASKAWPEKFLEAPKVGADLSKVWPMFAIWLLVDPDHGVLKNCKDFPDCAAAIERVAQIWQVACHTGVIDQAAESAAAWAAARAAWAAESAEAAESAAARAAAWAAAWAARAAWAAESAESAAAWAARAASESDFWTAASEKLLELMREAV